MWNTTLLIFLTLSMLMFGSCSSYDVKEAPLKIGVVSWVGYYPLFYASEKGWLKNSNIELIEMNSLHENLQMFTHGYVDVIFGTQYEYYLLLEKYDDIKLLKYLDKSNGGDMLLSNRTIAELQKSKHITVYLEINSVNRLVLLDFMNTYGISKNNVTLVDEVQLHINSAELAEDDGDIAIVSYVPYNYVHEKNGFSELLSTKSAPLLVMDSMIARDGIINNHKKQIADLKIIIDHAIQIANDQPTEFYNTISNVIPISKNDYDNSMSSIMWINRTISKEISNDLKSRNLIEY